MNSERHLTKIMLRNISPTKAVKLLNSCELPDDEHTLVLEHDIKQRELSAIADFLGISYTTAKRKHKAALEKIYDTIMNL